MSQITQRRIAGGRCRGESQRGRLGKRPIENNHQISSMLFTSFTTEARISGNETACGVRSQNVTPAMNAVAAMSNTSARFTVAGPCRTGNSFRFVASASVPAGNPS